jgi:hypothetical protein
MFQIALALAVVLLVILVGSLAMGTCREKYLIAPYLDDTDYADYRGSPYAFSDGDFCSP